MKNIIHFFKKLFWLVLLIFIALNITLFYFFNGIIYFLAFIFGNVILFWIMIPVTIWIGKTFLIDKGLEIVKEASEKLKNIDKKNIVKIIKKDER